MYKNFRKGCGGFIDDGWILMNFLNLKYKFYPVPQSFFQDFQYVTAIHPFYLK